METDALMIAWSKSSISVKTGVVLDLRIAITGEILLLL